MKDTRSREHCGGEGWLNHVLEQKASGLTQKSYCEKYKISKSAFWKWRQRYKEQEASFIEVPFSNPDKQQIPDVEESSVIEITYPNGIQLRLQVKKCC